MTFEKTLLYIKNGLNHSQKTRNEIYKQAIALRLNKTLVAYRQDLEYSLKYLYNRKPENVLKDL